MSSFSREADSMPVSARSSWAEQDTVEGKTVGVLSGTRADSLVAGPTQRTLLGRPCFG